mgnify:CR=1 FL=1
MISIINHRLGKKLASFLSKSPPSYQRLEDISLEDLAFVLESGDIVLVEGDTRISTAIKYLTQSSWSHACLYVGGSDLGVRDLALLEADLLEGVRMVSLEHYSGFNLRICRPVELKNEDREKLINYAKSKLGHKYDLKNILDLARYLIQKPLVPNQYRRKLLALGSGEPTKAICSTLIAESFQEIDYPILPEISDSGNVMLRGKLYSKRHFTHFTPRDFDLSPYFHIVKPTIEKGFNYQDIIGRDPAPENV